MIKEMTAQRANVVKQERGTWKGAAEQRRLSLGENTVAFNCCMSLDGGGTWASLPW